MVKVFKRPCHLSTVGGEGVKGEFMMTNGEGVKGEFMMTNRAPPL